MINIIKKKCNKYTKKYYWIRADYGVSLVL